MTDVSLSPEGPPETVLPPAPQAARARLAAAAAAFADHRHELLASVAAQWPGFVDAWAALGNLVIDDRDGGETAGKTRGNIEAYAYFRVGYHRGLDQLRRNGWRGNGYVRWRNETNRGFLAALDGLRRAAAAIGETEESARCDEFLHQLDPEWDRRTG